METQQRTQNCYPTEQIAQLETLVVKHNEGKSFELSYYILDLTGEKRVYFTLYSYNRRIEEHGRANPYRYIKNVSTDVSQAVSSIIAVTDKPILVAYDDNFNPLVTNFRKRTKEGVPAIQFGKYKGKTISEIWELDRKYVMWFNEEYKTKPFTDFSGRERYAVLSEDDKIMKEQAKELVTLFWNEWREKETARNQAECNSQFYGTLKVRAHLPATVTDIKVRDEYTTIFFTDRNGNILYTYDRGFNLEVGKCYSICGTPTKHIEKLGKKTTYLNRVTIEGETEIYTNNNI